MCMQEVGSKQKSMQLAERNNKLLLSLVKHVEKKITKNVRFFVRECRDFAGSGFGNLMEKDKERRKFPQWVYGYDSG